MCTPLVVVVVVVVVVAVASVRARVRVVSGHGGARCGCGCVPNILSLHEMAALRKKLREEAKAKAASM